MKSEALFMQRARWIFLIVCFFLLTGMGTNSPAGTDEKPVSPSEIDKLGGNKAPDFTLNNLKGEKISLSSFNGKVVILNFWATWCPSCIAEMPSLNELYREMKSDGLEIIAVSTDRSPEVAKKYVRKKGFDYTIVVDEDRKAARLFKVFSLPTTFLIDRNGVITEKFYGEYDWTDKEIKEKISRLLQ
jgi:peroxiredoxin